jgi:hypothetical protein
LPPERGASGFDSRQSHWGYGNHVTEPAERDPDERDLADRDPVEVLRAMLAISPEDAEKVREDAAKAMESGRQDDDD